MLMKIKAARVNAGYTQEEAAQMLGVSKSTIVNYEKYRTTPGVEMAERIAKLYGVKFEDIQFCKCVR